MDTSASSTLSSPLPDAVERITLQMASCLDLQLVLAMITQGLVDELDAAFARICDVVRVRWQQVELHVVVAQGCRDIRGHALHQLHRFHEAEVIARTLVTKREFVLDYALLGDTLMEQGRLAEAATAYQKMIDLKPFYQSYTRAAAASSSAGSGDRSSSARIRPSSAATARTGARLPSSVASRVA